MKRLAAGSRSATSGVNGRRLPAVALLAVLGVAAAGVAEALQPARDATFDVYDFTRSESGLAYAWRVEDGDDAVLTYGPGWYVLAPLGLGVLLAAREVFERRQGSRARQEPSELDRRCGRSEGVLAAHDRSSLPWAWILSFCAVTALLALFVRGEELRVSPHRLRASRSFLGRALDGQPSHLVAFQDLRQLSLAESGSGKDHRVWLTCETKRGGGLRVRVTPMTAHALPLILYRAHANGVAIAERLSPRGRRRLYVGERLDVARRAGVPIAGADTASTAEGARERGGGALR